MFNLNNKLHSTLSQSQLKFRKIPSNPLEYES